MRSFRESFSSFVQKFILVFILIELLFGFLAIKKFFYLFFEEIIKYLGLGSYFESKFFWDITSLVITLCLFFIAFVLRVFILLIKDRNYELHSKIALEEAKANIKTSVAIMTGDKK